MAIVATHVAAVQELYVAYFGRPADPAGLDYWTNVVEAQAGSTTAVSAAFATQPEYIVAYFGKTNAQVVDQIYLNLFGRGTSTTDGRAYWVDLLNKGTVGVSTIVAEVANGAQGSDGVAFENKVEAATAFTSALDTAAEQAGYAGADSLALAKTWISSITTDATLTAAIAPTALNAQVAAVVKAGTPFALESGIVALRAADKAIADFVKANDLDADTAEDQLDTAVTNAVTALNGKVAGYAAAPTDRQKAALLADEQKDQADEAKEAADALATARAGASTKAVAAADSLARATTAYETADKAYKTAVLEFNAAESFVEQRAGNREISLVDGVYSIAPAATTVGGTATPLIRVSAEGVVTLAPGVTEAAYPGVTAMAAAIRSVQDTQAIRTGADTALDKATAVVDALEDKADAVEIADLAATAAKEQKDVTDLAKLVATLEKAEAQVDAYAKLVTAQEVAVADFAAGGYLAPEQLNGPTAAALTGSDVFLLGSSNAVTLAGFGTSGDDVIYVGKNYTLNAGGLDKGVDTAMEIFFVQNGGRAEVHVEKAAYGSTSDDVIVISLVGVDAADLQLTDGVISLKDA